MAQYKITLESTILHDLFLGGAENEGVEKLLESVLNQVLQAQATEQLATDPYERTDERRGYRNGSYPAPFKTRVGTITLQVPWLMNGQFSTELFARYQQRASLCPGHDGDGDSGRFNPQGNSCDRGIVRRRILQVNRFF